VGRKKEIKAVLVLPNSERALKQFEKRLCDFYSSKVEQQLHSLPKKEKLEVLEMMISNCNPQVQSV